MPIIYNLGIKANLAVFIIICATAVSAQVPTAEVYNNTFQMTTDTLSGTAFLIEENGRTYVITARHLFRKKSISGEYQIIKLNIEGISTPYNKKVYFHDNPFVDVAVIDLKITLGNASPYQNRVGYSMGQDCFFLGFPRGRGTAFQRYSHKYPLIKKAIISGVGLQDGVSVIFLDGHNNIGFSGGPVVAYDYDTKKRGYIGVVQGYYFDTVKGSAVLDTAVVTNFTYEGNSGIVIVQEAVRYLEIIKKITN